MYIHRHQQKSITISINRTISTHYTRPQLTTSCLLLELLSLDDVALHEVEELELGSINTITVDVTRSEVSREDSLDVGLRGVRDNNIKTNKLLKTLGDGLSKDDLAEILVLPEVRTVDHVVERVDLVGHAVSEQEARETGAEVLAPDALELVASISGDAGLDLLDVGEVEVGDLTVLDSHVLGEDVVGEGESSEDLEGRRGDTTLVGRSILVEDDTSLLKNHAGILGDEEVSTLDNNLELGLTSLGIEEVLHVREVDGLGATTAGHEEISASEGVEVEIVTESNTGLDLLTVGEGNVGVVDGDEETAGGELGLVEVLDHDTGLGEASELLTVKTVRVVSDTGTVDDGDGLVLGDEDLVGTEITIRTTGLDLGALLLLEAELLDAADDVTVDGGSGHTESIVGDTTERRRLTGGECAPVRVAALLGVEGSPLHDTSGTFIRAEEEDLLLAVVVDDIVAVTGLGLGVDDEDIEEGGHEALEGDEALVLAVGVQENSTLGTELGDILVLEVLSEGKVEGLLELRSDVLGVALLVTRLDETDTTTRDIGETDVEALELSTHHEEDGEGEAREVHIGEELGVEAEGDGGLVGAVEVGLGDVAVEGEKGVEDLGLHVADDGAVDLGLEVAVGGDGAVLELVGSVAELEVLIGLVHELGVLEEGLHDTGVGDSLATDGGVKVTKTTKVEHVILEELGEGVVLIGAGGDDVEEELGGSREVGVFLGRERAIEEAGSEDLRLGHEVKHGELLHEVGDLSLGSGRGLDVEGEDDDVVGEGLDELAGGLEVVGLEELGEVEHVVGGGAGVVAGAEGEHEGDGAVAVLGVDLGDGGEMRGSLGDDLLVALEDEGGLLLEEVLGSDGLEVSHVLLTVVLGNGVVVGLEGVESHLLVGARGEGLGGDGHLKGVSLVGGDLLDAASDVTLDSDDLASLEGDHVEGLLRGKTTHELDVVLDSEPHVVGVGSSSGELLGGDVGLDVVGDDLGVEALEVDGGDAHLEEVVDLGEDAARGEDTAGDKVEVDIALDIDGDLLVVLDEVQRLDVGGVAVDGSTDDAGSDVLDLLGVDGGTGGGVETEDSEDLAVVDDRDDNTALEDRGGVDEALVDLTLADGVHENSLAGGVSLTDLGHLSVVLDTADVLTGNGSVVLRKISVEEVLASDKLLTIGRGDPRLSISEARDTRADDVEVAVESILDGSLGPHDLRSNLSLDRGNVGGSGHVAGVGVGGHGRLVGDSTDAGRHGSNTRSNGKLGNLARSYSERRYEDE